MTIRMDSKNGEHNVGDITGKIEVEAHTGVFGRLKMWLIRWHLVLGFFTAALVVAGVGWIVAERIGTLASKVEMKQAVTEATTPLEAGGKDREARLRDVEKTVTSLKTDLQWIKHALYSTTQKLGAPVPPPPPPADVGPIP